MNYSQLVNKIKEKKQAVIVIALVMALVLTTTLISSAVTASEKTTDFYDVKLGGKTVATVSSKKDADKIIEDVKSYYVEDDSKVVEAKLEPELTTDVRSCKESDKTPKIEKNTDKVVKHLVTGDVKEKKYTIKDGDTLWDVSGELDKSVDEIQEMNPEKDLDDIKPGDEITYQDSEPLVNVITEETVTGTIEVPFETETVGADSMYEDQTEVKQQGETGSNQVTNRVTVKNGKVVNSEVIETKVIKAPVKQIEVKGTMKRPSASPAVSNTSNSGASSAATASYAPAQSHSGGSIMGVARSYIGTPYSSMDCYAFCAAVYGQFGQGVMSGTRIPFSQAKPGDLLVFQRHHYGIYAGGNQVIHSIMGPGVTVTSIGYVSGYNGGVAYAIRK